MRSIAAIECPTCLGDGNDITGIYDHCMSCNGTGYARDTGACSVPKEAFDAAPEVVWGHVDGPLMIWAGWCHWLTCGERVMLFFRMTDLETIAFQRFHRKLT